MTTVVEDKPDALPLQDTETLPVEDQAYIQRYRRAQARVRAVRGFYAHLAVYLVVCAFLFAINMVTSRDALWFIWPVLGWGVFVALQGLSTFGSFHVFGPEWEERKIKEYMENDRPIN